MTSGVVIVIEIVRKNAMQMPFIQHDDMVETLSSYGADDPFTIRILPGRSWSDGNFFDIHAFHATCKIVSIDAITIADKKTWCFIVRKSVDDLLGGPFGVRIRGNIEVNDLSPVVTEYDEDVEDAKRDCGNREEIAGRNVRNVIIQKRSPSLGRRFSRANHVFGHSCFGDIMPQQGQFRYDPRPSCTKIMVHEKIDVEA